MNHDMTFTINRLRGMALRFERGEYDAEFAEAKMPIASWRTAIVRRIRAFADDLELLVE